MAKTMAIIKDGIVINLVWVDDNSIETEELKNTYNLHVRVGDVYSNNSYYRDSVKLITHREQLTKNIKDYDSVLTDIAILVNAPMTITEGNMPSIEDRKQAILMSIAGMNQALDMLSGEGGL
jgi:hypothetical protein